MHLTTGHDISEFFHDKLVASENVRSWSAIRSAETGIMCRAVFAVFLEGLRKCNVTIHRSVSRSSEMFLKGSSGLQQTLFPDHVQDSKMNLRNRFALTRISSPAPWNKHVSWEKMQFPKSGKWIIFPKSPSIFRMLRPVKGTKSFRGLRKLKFQKWSDWTPEVDGCCFLLLHQEIIARVAHSVITCYHHVTFSK